VVTRSRDFSLIWFDIIQLLTLIFIFSCVYNCCAFSSIHLASLLVLRDRIQNHPKTTYLRMVLLSIFGILLTVTISLSRYAFEPCFVLMQRFLVGHLKFSEESEFVLEYFLPAALISYIFWISIYQIVRRDKKPNPSLKRWQKILDFIVFGDWKLCFVVQIIFSVVSVVRGSIFFHIHYYNLQSIQFWSTFLIN
jgi:hypothetical protein